MLQFPLWKSILIVFTVVLGVLFALPNAFEKGQLENWPSFLPNSQMALGLDLRGGSHLLYQIDRDDVVQTRVKTLLDDTRKALSEAGIQTQSLAINGEGVAFTVVDGVQDDAVRAALDDIIIAQIGGSLTTPSFSEVDYSAAGNGDFTLSLTPAGLRQRMIGAIQQSVEVIGLRVNELGTTDPTIQRQGEDRVLVQVPGFDDPERLKKVIGTAAKLTFNLVDQSMSAEQARATRPPARSRLVPSTENPGSFVLIEDRPIVTGEDLVDSQPGFDHRNGDPLVTFRFNTSGAQKFGRATQQNTGRLFAIVLDDQVISAPRINEPILGGSGQISGNFTVESANDLSVLLRAGALPATLTIVEERTVGPGLGQDSIDSGRIASIIGFIAVIVFMVMVYGKFGAIADLALAANIVMIIGVLSFLGATLTLPGIAGIVLTVGMAVDANVLIYERVQEEIKAGRGPFKSIDSGYSRALGTILDANITTFIAAAILFYLGSGPVRGFAVTLVIGILTTLFCAFTFSRFLVAKWVLAGRPKSISMRWLLKFLPDNSAFKFMKHRAWSFPLSGLLVAASLVLFSINGLNLGIDFKGGTIVEIQTTDGDADLSAIRSSLDALNLGDVEVQEFGAPDDVLIRIEEQDGGELAQQEALTKVKGALGENVEYRRTEVVGPRVSGELAQAGIISVIAALSAVLVYIWFRFEWHFAIGAIIATVHDVALTIGLFALLQLEFNLSTIAAVLTIVGYSLNDTVVVYDRIRENLRKFKKRPVSEVLDLSINETLSRTVLTSVTTLLALLSLYFLGGEVIRSFTFAMIWGVVIGTFSSIFIASPLLLMLNLRPGAMDPDFGDKATAESKT